MAYQQRSEQRERVIRPYRVPEIKTRKGLTYNQWGALGLVYGINAPFVTKLAKTVRDDEGFILWSSPKLVLTLDEASAAFRNGDMTLNQNLIGAAVDFCNSFLSLPDQMPENTELRLAWIQYGLASVTCEENRKTGGFMDVVRSGARTFILSAPWEPKDASLVGFADSDMLLHPTGVDRPASRK